ncbi:helix-turn-helix domain-containing protein [Nocardia asteroides]|uniref:helix-turn-helix domain-containing protein n=1 Tax=Nocardia asteroides TaxID=1824 RepID=UPI0037A7EB95
MTDSTIDVDVHGGDNVDVDPMLILAYRVRELREERKVSQRGLAQQIAYSRTIVNRVENARWPVSWNAVEMIGTGLDATVSELSEWRAIWEAGLRYSQRKSRPDPAVPAASSAALAQLHLPESGAGEPAPVRPQGYGQDKYLPDPRVRSVGGYIGELRRLRASVDNPSFRNIAARGKIFSTTPDGAADGSIAPSHTTLHDLFKPGRVELRWEAVMLFLRGCGLTPDEIRHWHRLFQRLRYRPRERFVRQSDEHKPPPTVDLAGIETAAQFVGRLRLLARSSDLSMERVLRAAQRHPGNHLPCRSAVFARFRDAEQSDRLPERDVVISFLRGCYCRTQDGQRCVPDCKAALLVPWMDLYDELYHQSRQVAFLQYMSTDPRRHHAATRPKGGPGRTLWFV